MNNQILKTGLIDIAKYLPYKTGYFYTSLEKKKELFSIELHCRPPRNESFEKRSVSSCTEYHITEIPRLS